MPTAYIFYYILLLATVTISLARWQALSKADRVISILLVTTFISELLAYVVMKALGTNLPLHHFYTPIEFFLVSLYFNYSILLFRRWIGLAVGLLGIVASILNTLFIQPISGGNSYFLLFEGTAIIIYCLLAFHQILLDENYLPYHFAFFWITVCLILYWGVTYMGWGIYPLIQEQRPDFASVFDGVVKASNYVFYSGLALIFLKYNKLIPSGRYAY